jgi:hypothetical protein
MKAGKLDRLRAQGSCAHGEGLLESRPWKEWWDSNEPAISPALRKERGFWLQIVAGSGQLEIKLSSQLNQPRIVGLYHLSEVAGVDVTNRVEELGMIEDVVGFKS